MADTSMIPADLILLLLAIGCMGGFLSGLLGVGGGIIFVPALFFSLSSLGFSEEHAMHIAIGSSLAVVMATGSTSAFSHYKRGGVDIALLRAWSVPIVIGVLLGAVVASSVKSAVLKEIFAGMTLIIALYMAFSKDRTDVVPLRFLTQAVQKFLAAVIGLVSAMLGVGGAILTVPLMSYIGLPMPRAVGTGAALGVAVAVPGVLSYMVTGFLSGEPLPPWSIGYVNLLTVAMIIPSSMLLAPLGVKVSHNMPRAMLRRVFAAVLMIVSVRMFLSL
ncbi:MAG: sulfite exporter TauE/SafE family protein [Parvibaculum sp.]|uniref:sulfite exporter TauE/SafE family protein n=1 Tax=Parvibaculum sp. TaxID=2024848 RepID=UPI002730DC08|nr:sulfite exporter TauE/SafE family protein [Parvibaculum sp.]MDP2148828.1 sulfite exporter TauE/SafE family protein [Parvibaculum sp.]